MHRTKCERIIPSYLVLLQSFPCIVCVWVWAKMLGAPERSYPGKPWGQRIWVLPWRGRGILEISGQGVVRPNTPLPLQKQVGKGGWPGLRRVETAKTAWRGWVHSSPPKNGMLRWGTWQGSVWAAQVRHSCRLEWGEPGAEPAQPLTGCVTAVPRPPWLYSLSLERAMFTLKDHRKV